MTHRAALYRVYVHELYQPSNLRRLGNFDGKGTQLSSVLNGYLTAPLSTREGDRSLEAVSSVVVGDEIETIFRQGQSGEAADIFDRQHSKKLLHQNPQDWHEVTVGSLLQLPRNSTEGWWAAHVQGIRSAKALAFEAMSTKFRSEHDPFKLVVAPAISTAVLTKAIEDGHITQIKLTRIERPTDIRERITSDWVRSEDRSLVELLIRPGKGTYLLNNLILKHLKGNEAATEQILEFGNINYDRAQVEVELDSGATRTFNIENLAAGHPFTVVLDQLVFNNAGEPTPESIFGELRRAIEEFV